MPGDPPSPTAPIDAAVVAPLRATAADLPAAAARALADAPPDLSGARRATVPDGLIPWATLAWGDPLDPPLVLVHGVTSSADTFWRVGPAVAAAGHLVVAVDLPGHGRTGAWQGRHRFGETARELAGFLRASGLARPDLAVLGHSWGAMVVAALPGVGLRPERLVLLDPPALPVAAMELMTHDPTERHYDDPAEALAAIRAANPGWSAGDLRAKAFCLTQFDSAAALAVLTGNGDWDGGLVALADPAAAGIPVWVIRGQFASGGLIPESAVPALADRVGVDHLLTIADGAHSPQRTHPEATVLAILRALA